MIALCVSHTARQAQLVEAVGTGYEKKIVWPTLTACGAVSMILQMDCLREVDAACAQSMRIFTFGYDSGLGISSSQV